jgi:hypothetical protein
VKFSEINCAATSDYIMGMPRTRSLVSTIEIALTKSLLAWLLDSCIGPKSDFFEETLPRSEISPNKSWIRVPLYDTYLQCLTIRVADWNYVHTVIFKKSKKKWPRQKSHFFLHKWANKPLWPQQVVPYGTSMVGVDRVFYLGSFGLKLLSHGSLKVGKMTPNWCFDRFWGVQAPQFMIQVDWSRIVEYAR